MKREWYYPTGKVICGRGIQAWMGESDWSLGRPDDLPAYHAAGSGHRLCDQGWVEGCAPWPAPLFVGRFLESGPAARVVATGLEGCRHCFHRRPDPGLDLPGHRAFWHLDPGIAADGNDSSSRPVCDAAWPCHSARTLTIGRDACPL